MAYGLASFAISGVGSHVWEGDAFLGVYDLFVNDIANSVVRNKI